MDALTPWPAFVRRLRFLSGLKQSDLAQQLGVEQATVSRWERGRDQPSLCYQRRLRDMFHKLEPAIDRAFVEQAHACVSITRIGNAGYIECMSKMICDTYQHTPEDMRNIEVYGIATPSILKLLNALNANEAWCKGEVASWQGLMQHCDGTWVKFSGAPLGQSGLCISIGSLVAPPEVELKDGFQLIINPYDEMVD